MEEEADCWLCEACDRIQLTSDGCGGCGGPMIASEFMTLIEHRFGEAL